MSEVGVVWGEELTVVVVEVVAAIHWRMPPKGAMVGMEVVLSDKMSVYDYLAEDSCTVSDSTKGEEEREEVYSRSW